MQESASLLSVLPNLSIAAVAIIALVYVIRVFMGHLKDQRIRDEDRQDKKDQAFRDLEKEVRTTVMKQLADNTKAMTDSAKGYERVIDHLNYDNRNRDVKVQVNNVQPPAPQTT